MTRANALMDRADAAALISWARKGKEVDKAAAAGAIFGANALEGQGAHIIKPVNIQENLRMSAFSELREFGYYRPKNTYAP